MGSGGRGTVRVCVWMRETRSRGQTVRLRGAPGTVEGARGRRPCCVRKRRARRRVCAEAPGAQCVYARARGARAPQFSRTPRGGGDGAGVRVTSPRAPADIARRPSRARIRAGQLRRRRAWDSRSWACLQSRSWEPASLSPLTVGSQRARGAWDFPRSFAASPRSPPCAAASWPARRAGPEEEAEAAEAEELQEAVQQLPPWTGNFALGPGRDKSRERLLRVFPAFSPPMARASRGGTGAWGG